MVNKSGWFRVFEASLATLLIIGSFLFLITQTPKENDFVEKTINLRIEKALENIDLNISLRKSILSNETGPLLDHFGRTLGTQISYKFKIYPLGEEYFIENVHNKEVNSYSRILSAEDSNYSPKLIVLNIYRN